ncbi:uncharacterized protein [Pocillopora verrucosa]|uniref:uncharacterized protein isoform X2 n=1 Tax=Pocillopora verrucosa TaxID=203993 RepID=UPI002797663A|nr:uncharacterized protein LOC131774846 isoform X2 [Pocillopora verrucosa]
MAVGRGFFDQYSVFCVFGSVVGCVVVPLITQSVESVIFSAIVISLTATHLTKRASKSENSSQVNTKEVDRRNSRKLKDREREQLPHIKKRKPATQQTQITSKSSDNRKKKPEDQFKLDLAKQLELERKQEEKKEKKVKKKEERLKRKEHEREEKEKEEQKLKIYKEQRQREMKENLKQGDKNTHPPLQRVDSGKTRFSTVKLARKLESSTIPKSPPKVPASPVLATHAQFLSRQRSQSEGSEGEPSTPPPSVWKVPEYVEPKWNPGKPESKTDLKKTLLNNDIVCAKVKLEPPFNQLHNPVYNSQSFKKNQFMNQNPEKSLAPCETKSSSPPAKVLEKPDNRFNTYSSFSGLDLLSQLKEEGKLNSDTDVRSYSLFGPDEPNSAIFRSPLTGH